MKKLASIYTCIAIALIATSCSTKKDKSLNRGYHAMTTKYNVMYNGTLAYQEGIDQLNANFEDDYWQRLPIEPLKIEKLVAPGATDQDQSNGSFGKAEEKTVKAIQKHGMQIRGKERNQQIDGSYLLLGKSRYYSQRFIPALEAFNYLLRNHHSADLTYQARIWQAKSQLRLRNENQALESLKLLLNQSEFLDEEIIEDAHTAIAMVYTAMDSTEQVIHHLKQATQTKNNKEQRARNLFILGQIYSERDKLDSSQIAFQQVEDLKRRIPYKYIIHAQIEKAKNRIDHDEDGTLQKTLSKLIKDRENRPYLDEIHYLAGLSHLKAERQDAAIEHFVKSIHTKQAKQFQKGLSYEQLGNISFDKAKYTSAGAYYDSVINISLNSHTKRIRTIKRKRKNLVEVITFEDISHRSDSILKLAAMSLEEQEEFFTAYIEKLKLADIKAKELQDKINAGFEASNLNNTEAIGNGKWYFYNIQATGYGQQDFQQTWGKRPLEDNWRLSDKTIIQENKIHQEDNINLIEIVEIEANKRYNIYSYIDLIPTESAVIDSISALRNNAYYNLGLIYKEQFNKNEMASNRLEKLLTFSPAKRYILPSKYQLYKIFSETNPLQAEKYKEDIVTNSPETKYAKLILDPNAILTVDNENSPERIYEKVYLDFEEKNYNKVITQSETAIKQYDNLPILPKFELLRAYAIGREEGVTAFKTALEFVALNYSNTEEGKKALKVIETIKKLN